MGTHKRKQHTPPTHSPPGDEGSYCSAAGSMCKHPLSVPLPDHATQRTNLATKLQLIQDGKVLTMVNNGTLPLPPSRPTSHRLQGKYLITTQGGTTALDSCTSFALPPMLQPMEMRSLSPRLGALKRHHQGREMSRREPTPSGPTQWI